LHNQAHEAIEAIESVMGTTAGTSVLKNVSAGQFVATTGDIPVKASGAEIDTGTDDAKFVTAKAITDSKITQNDKEQTLTNKTLTNPTINFTDKASNVNVKASAYRNAALNINDQTWTEVVCDAELYDVGEDFNVANGRFTAPVAGYYLVSAYLSLQAPGDQKRIILGISKDGSNDPAYRAYTTASGTNDHGLVLSRILYLTVGQTVSLWVWHNAGGAKGLNTGDSGRYTGIDVHLLSV
jgi:hypothetical protein